MDNNKFFCDKCSRVRYGEVKFCTFDKHRDFVKHLTIKKHLDNCRIIDEDPASIECKCCKEKFSVEGFKVHKERNQHLWQIKRYLGDMGKYLTCNRFQWEDGGRRFSTFKELLEHRDKQVVKAVGTKKIKKITTFKESYKKTNFSYRPDFQNKSKQERAEIIDKEEYEETGERPQLEMCELCYKYIDEDNKYSLNHLTKWDMKLCNCVWTTDDED